MGWGKGMSGKSKIEIDREGEIDYAKPLPRALLRDSRLSFGARGLFAFLWDLPRGWTIRLVHLIRMAPEGRDALRSRLRELEAVGAIRIESIRVDGGKFAGKRWILVSADRWAVEAALQDDSTVERVFPSSADSIMENPAAKVLQGSKVLQGEAAAPRAHARGTDAAAPLAKGKRRIKRTSGIVTWTVDDLPEAERIEQQYGADLVGAAVAALIAAGKEPVPGLVARGIERQQRDRDAAERRAAADAQLQKQDQVDLDPAAMAKGAKLLSADSPIRHRMELNYP